ncbi:MAG: HNH endonuclease signature motif containing protein [Candidatus Krumholzibacteriota bacterium]
MITIPTAAGFQTGQSAAVADSSLKTAISEMDDAKHRAVLWFADIMKRGLFRKLGYSNMPQYASSELKFSKTRTGDFMRLARKLDELPAVAKSLADGDLGYTKVVEIIKVATPVTEDHWVAEAAKTGRRELAKKVKRVKAKARRRKNQKGQGTLLSENPTERKLVAETPVRMSLEMTPEQFARFEALMEKIRKLNAVPGGSSRVDAMLSGLEELARGTPKPINGCEETSSATPARRRVFSSPFQVHVHRCPECSKSTVQTSRGELDISEADAKRAECDARVKQAGKPNTATIAPGRRFEVFQRDRYRCRAPGCGNSRFLEVHHVRPRSVGGGNDPENLVTLCSGCHRLHHEGRLRI